MIFQGLSVVRNCLRPGTAPLTILAIKRGRLRNFAKNKEAKCISVQISKKFKGFAISSSKMCRSKIFVTQKKLPRILEIHYKIFDNSHLKFGKREKAKIEK